MAKNKIKNDCIFVTPSGRGCSALNKMYCKTEQCVWRLIDKGVIM